MKLRDARDDKSGSFSGCCSRSEMAGMCLTPLRWVAAGPKSNIAFSTTALRVCRCDTTLGFGVLQLALLRLRDITRAGRDLRLRAAGSPSSNDLIA
jgi:hypothetical protein